jgi:hypothetical protein
MPSNFLPSIKVSVFATIQTADNQKELYDLLVDPLHEELYNRQTFDFLSELSWGQQLILSTDYMQMHVGQGGFIQFIHNGYVSLLPNMIEQMYQLNEAAMANLLDDVLKIYVLNRDLIESATSVQEFAKLYDELKEFEEIDTRYQQLIKPFTINMLQYAANNINEFATIIADN